MEKLLDWTFSKGGIGWITIIIYYLYWVIMLALDVGTYTDGPNLITWYIVIWIPILQIAPFYLGYVAGKDGANG